MLPRWQGGIAASVVTAVAAALVVLEIMDGRVRDFWSTHALTTDTVAGLLVVAVTVVVVDQLMSRRQLIARSRAVAAQGGLLLMQANRSVKSVQEIRDSSGDLESAREDLRAYLLMLLVSAPVLIEDPVARRFLEQAQRVAAEMGKLLVPSEVSAWLGPSQEHELEAAIERLKEYAAPLLAVLSGEERSAVMVAED